MSAASTRRRMAIAARVGIGAVALLAFVCIVQPSIRGTGEIRHRGGLFRVPVPYLSIETASREGRAIYWTPGRPTLNRMFASRGPSFGWTFGEQLGSLFTLVSTSDENVHLVAITELKPLSTQIEFHVEER
jgi:hypothetical protein